MCAEPLQEWLREHRAKEVTAEVETEAEAERETSKTEGRESATKEGIEYGGAEREPTKWDMVVELVQIAFQDGVLADAEAWQAVLLIPKGGGD